MLLIAVAALGTAGHPTAAVVYAGTVIANAVLRFMLGDDPGRWLSAGPRA